MLYGLSLLVLASGCWAALDGLRKLLVQKINPLSLTAALCGGQAGLFFIAYALTGFPIPDTGYWLYGLLCSSIALVAALGLHWSLRLSPLSQCIPMLSLTPAFAMVHGYLLLGETLHGSQIVGLILSTLGAAGFGLAKGWTRAKGAYLMVGVAFLFSLTMALDKVALGFATVPTHAFFQAAFISLCLGLFMWKNSRVNDLKEQLSQQKRNYGAAVLVFALAVGLQLEAVKWIDVSLLEAGKRCIGLFSAIFVGRWLFHEPITARKLLSACLLAIGVWVILVAH